ncbi:MAG: neuromedin U [Gammaproteobacteria bacterium]
MTPRLGTLSIVVILFTQLLVCPVSAQDEATELNKKTQNPVSDLISVPFQNNFYFGTGTKDATVYVLNVQPIIPIQLTEDWNLIARIIMPIINQPALLPGAESAFGLGDINPTLFLSPAKPGALIWGVGPTFTFPTATADILGASKWSAGPAVVGLMTRGPWLFGALVNHQWSFAGSGKKDVSVTTINPFLNYNVGKGLAIGTSPIITADWEADSHDRWTVPLGLGVSQVLKVGPLPVKFGLSGYYNVERPRFGSDWQLQFTATFLFPK